METESSIDLKTIQLDAVKGVLVDLDNTFYDYEPCHQQGLKSAYQEYTKTQVIDEEKFYELYKQAQVVIKQRIPNHGASHSRLLYFQNITEQVEKRTNMEVSLTLEDIYWDVFQKTIILRKEVINFLQLCKKKSIKICILTDLTGAVQFRKMVAIGLETLVDFVVTSEEAGGDKPYKPMFSIALEKLNLREEDVIMIGDDITKDIDGARKQNIKAFLI